MTWAFSDESERGNLMLFGLMTLPAAAVPSTRQELRGLLLPGQRRIHTAKESPRRRRELLGLVARLEVRVVVFELRRPPGLHRNGGRELLLRAACREALASAVSNWVLDDQEPVQAARDRRAIDAELRNSNAPLVYDHRAGHDEPLLWAVDALVWAVGVGGHSSARVRTLVEERTIVP